MKSASSEQCRKLCLVTGLPKHTGKYLGGSLHMLGNLLATFHSPPYSKRKKEVKYIIKHFEVPSV
jgi:hypothetical protein